MNTLNQLTRPMRDQRRHVPSRESEQRAAGIGVLCTIVFHALLFIIAPLLPAEKFTGSHSNLDAIAAAREKTFDIELESGETEERKNPLYFVETNPDAPENEPDKTDAVSNRNQQSAQQERPPEIDPLNRPSVKGQDEIESDSIVSGDRAPPQPATPEAVAEALEQALAQAEQQARAEQVPLSGNEKVEGRSEDGVGSNISRNDAPSTNAPEYLEGSRDSRNPTGGLVAVPQVNRQVPRERPRLSSASTARTSPLQNRVAGTANIGVLGRDARWSEFGDYMAELIAIVDAEWQAITYEYRGHIPAGSRVKIEFVLNSDGEIKVVSVEETAGRVAVGQCQAAIINRMPYRKWSRQMIAVLGDEQRITFGFHY
jgi:hypothetical protein